MRCAVLLALLLVLVSVRYSPPVEAPIVDHFRPPAAPWAPGNRGIDYATVPGMLVRAAADGIVSFAGPVGPALHVAVAHPDGLRTSYSFLRRVLVQLGQRVARGTPVGEAAARLHFGVRRGREYLDPEMLLVAGRPRPRLVPVRGPAARAGNRGAAAWGRVPAVQ